MSVHICFHHPHATLEQWRAWTQRRKPGAGMLYEALEAHSHYIDSRRTELPVLFIGDMETDEQAAELADIPFTYADEFFAE